VSHLSAQLLLSLTRRLRLRHLLHLHHCHGTCLAKRASTIRNLKGLAHPVPLARRPLLVISNAPRAPQEPPLILQAESQAARTAQLEPSQRLAHRLAQLAVQATTRPLEPLSALNAQLALALNTRRALALLQQTQSVKNVQRVLAQSITALSALHLPMLSAVHAKHVQQQSTGFRHALDQQTLSASRALLALALNTGRPCALLLLTQSALLALFATAPRMLKQPLALHQATLSVH